MKQFLIQDFNQYLFNSIKYFIFSTYKIKQNPNHGLNHDCFVCNQYIYINIQYHISYIMGNQLYKQLKQRAIQHRNRMVEQQLKQVCEIIHKYEILPERFIKLTIMQAIDLLNDGSINSEMLVAALAYNSATIGKRLNLYTVTNFQQALQLARACDAKRKQSGLRNWKFDCQNKIQKQQWLPPLFGVPISIKDVIDMKGFPTTIGLASRTSPCSSDSPLIKCLKNSGVIPFIKSNTPQYCMSAQTNNNLWGRSISPWNPDRSVGGTSGGEGGLIASGCSLIGLGSDIGGSIRLPAEHCGVVGLKTSSKRISNTYHAELSKVFTGMTNTIPLCLGPLAKCTEGLALFMKTVTDPQYYRTEHDPYTKIIPFDEHKYLTVKQNSKKFKIGYISKLAQIEPSATSIRALNQVIQILKKLGHQLVPIAIPMQKQLIREYLTEISIGKGKYMRQILAREKPSLQNQMVLDLLQMSTPMRAIASFYAKHALPSAYYYSFSKQVKNVMEYQTHIGEIGELKRKFIEYWRSQSLDFVVCPGFPCPAIPHGQSNKLGYPLAYTFIWNILDMVAGALPVTIVREDQQIYVPTETNMFSREMAKCIAGSVGLPAGVQVIGLPYAEEQVLGLMALLQRQIKFNSKYEVPRVGQMRMPGGFTID